jgi:hypothetical protein
MIDGHFDYKADVIIFSTHLAKGQAELFPPFPVFGHLRFKF